MKHGKKYHILNLSDHDMMQIRVALRTRGNILINRHPETAQTYFDLWCRVSHQHDAQSEETE